LYDNSTIMEKDPEEIAECAKLACVVEASAEKPGNVTPTHGFEDISYEDFIQAAERLEPFIERAARQGENAEIGKLIFEATSKEKNVNFGIIMMFIPLAATGGESTSKLLKSLTARDTQWIVEAMRKGKLGGMGLKDEKLSKYDIFSDGIFEVIDKEDITPLKLMEMAQPHDTLAREWVEDYPITRHIAEKIDEENVIELYLEVLSEHPDTLISRKTDMERSKEVSAMAKKVLEGESKEEFDKYLRLEGNSLNPGTTADLIASGLFLKLISAAQ